jgi:hypothetical protein
MPNFYAHIRFCLAVRQQLPPKLRAILTAERDAFLCGGFGPDPLYFYTGSKGPGTMRQVGVSLHHGTGAAALEPFRQAVLGEKPYGVSFAAGYLLHYLLDAQCHPYVKAVAQEGELTHFALEGEYDRYLLKKDGLSYRAALPQRELPETFYETAACMAPQVTPEVYRQALRSFRLVAVKLGDWAGTPLHYGVNALSRVPKASPLRGMILGKKLLTAQEPHVAALDQCCQEAVPLALVELGRFFEAIRQGMPFSEALGRDFSGREEIKDGIH